MHIRYIARSWYNYKWLNWTESSRWLNPVFPPAYERAIPFPLGQPDFAEEFAMPIPSLDDRVPKFGQLAGETFYDTRVNLLRFRKSVGRVVKSVFAWGRSPKAAIIDYDLFKLIESSSNFDTEFAKTHSWPIFAPLF